MNTKGNTQSKAGANRKVLMARLRSSLQGVSDEDAIQAFEEMYKKKEGVESRMEEALYPIEFLHVMQDTMFGGLKEYLRKMGAATEAVDLVEDLEVFMTWRGTVDGSEGQQVDRLVNDMLSETIASATRHIVKLGSSLYSPYGEIVSRKG